MKSSLRRLRGLAPKNEAKEEEEQQQRLSQAKQDELLQASQDMQDMRDCYDSLLSAAAATANSAYEFSEALQEMGTCFLEKTSLNDDEESGKVLLMLGKLQFILQKLMDNYRSHIIQTITTPSESLVKELQTVEEMKRQCDYKRDSYEVMLAAHKEKGRSRNAKDETISSQQLQSAKAEFEEEATLLIFRLKSLKQGQSRSLLTQAARHHAAQLHFFREGLKVLEVIEPHVKVVAEQQHIDYQFSGLEDDGDDGYSYDGSDDGESSFDYGQSDQGQDVSTSRNLMELDPVDHTAAPPKTVESTQGSVDRSQAEFLTFGRGHTTGIQSAPIIPNTKFDSSEKIKEMQPSLARKFHSYALPPPISAKSPALTGPGSLVSAASLEGKGGWPMQLWHSSPLHAVNFLKDPGDDKRSGPNSLHKGQTVLKESNINSAPKMPPLLAELLPQVNPNNLSDAKKIKRKSFSGPLTSKTWSNKLTFSGNDSRHSVDYSPLVSLVPTCVTTPPRSVSPKVSHSTSPPPVSSPKISELHELPRPPVSSTRPSRPFTLIGDSAPLVSRGQEQCTTTKMPSIALQKASPLPMPPKSMARSFSIPSSSQRTPISSSAMLLEATHNPGMLEEVISPTLMPIPITTSQAASTAPYLFYKLQKRKNSCDQPAL